LCQSLRRNNGEQKILDGDVVGHYLGLNTIHL